MSFFWGDDSDDISPLMTDNTKDYYGVIMTDAAVKDTFISVDMEDNKNIFTTYPTEVIFPLNYLLEVKHIYNIILLGLCWIWNPQYCSPYIAMVFVTPLPSKKWLCTWDTISNSFS